MFKWKNQEKIILIDYGYVSHRSIYAQKGGNEMPLQYICMSIVLGNLRKIGVNKKDKIIIACEGGSTWRKKLFPVYKGDRPKIDQFIWDQFNELIEILKESTNWEIIKVFHFEADDVIAYAVKHFKNQENIILSIDSDFIPLYILNEVSDCCESKISFESGKMYCKKCNLLCNRINNHRIKMFSPLENKKKGGYKILDSNEIKEIDLAYKMLAEKINSEAGDNLKGVINDDEMYQNRKMVVDLVTLPDFVESALKPSFENLRFKEWSNDDFYLLRFPKIIGRMNKLYDNEGTVKYEDSMKCFLKKESKIKKKKGIKKQRVLV